MSSEAKAPKSNKVARTNTVSPATPPSSPTMQCSNSKPAVTLPKRTDTSQARTVSSCHRDTSPKSLPMRASTHQEVAQLLKDAVEYIMSDAKETAKTTAPQVASTTASKPAVRGTKLEVKEIQEVWDSVAYAYKIVESPTVTEVKELDTYAFVIRTLKAETRSIVYVDIKLPGLRDILRAVLKDIKWVSLADDKPSFEHNLLFHYLPELEEYQASATRDEARDLTSLKALNLLIHTIKDRAKAPSERLDPLLREGKITYDLLWALFKANSHVITTCLGSGQLRCLQYNVGEEKKTEQGVEYFELQCQYLDFDGKVFGTVTERLPIERFHGARPITTLDIYPLYFHPTPNKIMQSLIERGRNFMSLMGSHHRIYDGVAFRRVKDGLIRKSVQSKIMIDTDQFRKTIPSYARIIIKKTEEGFFSDFITTQQRVMDGETDLANLPEDKLVLCPPTVLGFSLNDKFWGEYAVDHIQGIEPSSALFDHLSIPIRMKNTIRSLTRGHLGPLKDAKRSGSSMSVVGSGTRILLHGPPGVGKTLTAEALSEYHRRPLYSVSAGELSSDAGELDPQLTDIFRVACAWNAILLIDEADVFLQRRAELTLERNRLVAVFLRKLEHFDGILILTTNLVDHFDSAILDRMHLQMQYHPLDKAARKEVVIGFLTSLCGEDGLSNFGADYLDRFACMNVNGRQIKNTVSIAYTLSTEDEDELSCLHIDHALEATGLRLPQSADEPFDLYD
ncbi:hypothetical protein PMZ80_011313 [Knufia obscura]|uniref:AAA+ ATPase domain-containing protein n=2 Tax=Knufia TaxID=430999 RepID=A0AAN8EIK5_9EURO|nr:hypothetical protein PMZ80_011313 [Knufia obscura]KAK5950430.1 hypothetical protein OHC33_008649 [Knufia fluminis]